MNDHLDTVALDGELAAAAEELVAIKAARKHLDEREAAVKELLLKALNPGERGVAPDGTPLVAVRAGQRRFNPERARLRLPADTYAGLLTLQVDKDRARTVLAPALWDECCDITAPSVVAL